MKNKNLKNFLDDIEISKQAKEFWARIAYKLSLEELEAFIILKKQNPQDLVKAIDILMRKEKAVIENNSEELRNIFEEVKEIFRN